MKALKIWVHIETKPSDLSQATGWLLTCGEILITKKALTEELFMLQGGDREKAVFFSGKFKEKQIWEHFKKK